MFGDRWRGNNIRWWVIWKTGQRTSCFFLPSVEAFSASFILFWNSSSVSSMSSKPSGGGLRFLDVRMAGIFATVLRLSRRRGVVFSAVYGECLLCRREAITGRSLTCDVGFTCESGICLGTATSAGGTNDRRLHRAQAGRPLRGYARQDDQPYIPRAADALLYVASLDCESERRG